MTKVYYMGREVNGRYSSFKTKVKHWVRRVIRIMALSLVVGLGSAIGAVFLSSTSVSAVAPQTIDLTPQKIDGLKNEIVNSIFTCEAAGHSEEDGLIVFDTNAKASVGQGQFQIKTVQYYYKTLYGKDLTPKEAILVALDTEKAKSLAKDIIFSTKNESSDWLNCSNKLGLTAQIRAIKKLEK